MKSKLLYSALQNMERESGRLHDRNDFIELGKELAEKLNPEDLESLLFGIYSRQPYISDPANVGDSFLVKNPFYQKR